MHLVLGGARSGKTRYAEEQALRTADLLGAPATYLATGVITDDEMASRIARHKNTRSKRYQTLEQARSVDQVVRGFDPACSGVVMIDCLATYLGTLMFDAGEEGTEDELRRQGELLAVAMDAYEGPLYVVSNEVGSGIVPAYKSARLYRDVLGAWNSHFARLAQDVTLLVSGLPLALKRNGLLCGQG